MKTAFYQHNRKRLMEQVSNESLVVLFAGEAPYSSADELYQFIPNRNFYYLTGSNQPKQILVLTKDQDTVETILFIEKADPILEKWIGKRMTKEEATERTGIDNIMYLEDFESYLQRLLLTTPYQQLYLNLEKRNWDGPDTPALAFAKDIQSRYPQLAIKNSYHAICEMRVFKTPEEIAKIKEAIRITQDGIRNVMAHAKPGMKEYELEAHFDFVLKSNGITRHAFHTIAASGHNGTVLHYGENNDTANDGELLLLDLGAQFEYYNADISHTFPVNGKFTDRQKVFYNIVLNTLKEITAMIKPGLKFAELNETTKKLLAKGCIEAGLIEKEEDISQYYFHGVSHFLGLDTHDVGTYKHRVLEPGMILTVEPGLYIPEENIGIRIEDDVLVTETGHENLSHDLIRSVQDLEAFLTNN